MLKGRFESQRRLSDPGLAIPVMPPRRHKLTPRTRNIVLGVLLVAAIVGTLAGVPIGVSADNGVKIPQTYVSVKSAFAPLDPSRTIPKNILADTVVPIGSQVVARENLDNHNSLFDRSVSFSLPESRAKLAAFELATFKHFGWRIRTQTHTATSLVYYCQKGGSDGNFWELSATITRNSVPALGNSSSVTNSLLTIRLLIESFS